MPRRLDNRQWEGEVMRSASTTLAVLNSLLYVRDPTLNNRPEIDGIGSFWSTPDCLALSCLPDSEGDTAITIGPAPHVTADILLLFDGELNTPSRTVIVEGVPGVRLLEVAAPDTRSRVRIWTNGRVDTDRVTIGLG